jgi:hypothetical protein
MSTPYIVAVAFHQVFGVSHALNLSANSGPELFFIILSFTPQWLGIGISLFFQEKRVLFAA